MVVLLCFFLALLTSPYKSKSRLESRECRAPKSADRVAAQGQNDGGIGWHGAQLLDQFVNRHLSGFLVAGFVILPVATPCTTSVPPPGLVTGADPKTGRASSTVRPRRPQVDNHVGS